MSYRDPQLRFPDWSTSLSCGLSGFIIPMLVDGDPESLSLFCQNIQY